MEFVKGMRKVKGEWLWEGEQEEQRTRKKVLEEEENSWSSLACAFTRARIVFWYSTLNCPASTSKAATTEPKPKAAPNVWHFLFTHRFRSQKCRKYHSIRLLTPMTSIYYGITVFRNKTTTKKQKNKIVIDVSECGTCHLNVALRSLFHPNEISLHCPLSGLRNLFRITQ